MSVLETNSSAIEFYKLLFFKLKGFYELKSTFQTGTKLTR